MDANGSAVSKVGCVVSFVQKDGFRFFPCGWCLACDPHDDEQVPQRLLEAGGHDANEFIGNAVRARAFVISEFGDYMLESVRSKHIW
jgi:hypothetical protein